MSAAASQLELETPQGEVIAPFESSAPSGSIELDKVDKQHDREALEKLTGIAPPGSSTSIIAVDLDDVLCETNDAVAEWHNEVYGTKMQVSDFYYYYYWKNPYWGSIQETFDKVIDFYKTDKIYTAGPVPGAREGIQTLKDMGFRLIIVTARQEDKADESWKWVTKHFPGLFDSIICTGQFKDAHKTGHEVVTKLSKSQVCEDIGAKLLIDDSAENGLQCVNAPKPVPVLLFGDYEWNQRVSGPGDACHEMTFDVRFKACGGKEFWKEETVPIPEGAPLWRVKDWSEVIRWVRKAMAEGQI
ncbi:hypothetical protein P691DRAFT_654605 [Macrolepiota fuliginosa MF-IS2]|uniref:Uncharacterized protein n=1 Tax=Macrolepiota fuliginosa MF-IS2 TaxID=1400762 RepID=A0A9P6CAH6_9AGAR|nr:hypothetical protein P691DRAFT_654605 [Macrolepiota fuliginosa MF-IS2]